MWEFRVFWFGVFWGSGFGVFWFGLGLRVWSLEFRVCRAIYGFLYDARAGLS